MTTAELTASVGRLVDLQRTFRVVDVSQPLEEHMPVWPTLSKFYHTLWLSLGFGDNANSYQIIMNEHTGTHVDATGHYLPDGHSEHRWIDQIPPETWMGRAPVIDCQDLSARGEVTPDRILRWEKEYGRIEPGDIVVFNYGWWKKWAIRPNEQEFMRDWPGLGLDAVDLLLERGVKAIGSDTPSPEVFGVPGDQVHHKVLDRGVVIIENLTNLDQVSPLCFLVALPLPIRGGTGSPTRAVAFVPR